jgi:hypothetical protein
VPEGFVAPEQFLIVTAAFGRMNRRYYTTVMGLCQCINDLPTYQESLVWKRAFELPEITLAKPVPAASPGLSLFGDGSNRIRPDCSEIGTAPVALPVH